jgi:O-antigen/teichoic acid export membrane protein
MDDRDITRSFRRGFATLFVVDLITKGLTAATVVILIRGLSVSIYAYVTLLLAIAQLTASAAGGGILTRYLREESEQASRGFRESTDGQFLEALAKASLIIAVFGICIVPLVKGFGIGTEFGGASLVILAVAFAAGSNATDLAIARHQARRRFSKAGALNVIRAFALLVSAVIVSFADNVLVIGGWLVASMLVVALASAGGALRTAPGARDRLRINFSREEAWLSFFSFASAGFAYVDILVASALLGEHQVSTLGASLRYWAVVLSAMPALGAVLRVRTAQFDIVDSPARQRSMVLSWIRRTSIPAALLTTAAFLLAPVLIPEVDGGKYPGSIAVFRIFLVTAFVAYTTAPAGTILIARRRYDVLGSVYGLGLILNLIGDIIVAQPFGVTGIAVVSSIVYLAIGIVVTLLAIRGRGAASTNSQRRITV